ncbi:uncharacterized protein LOC106158976 [Lingula anatina]|uniref:Uncharacterized protein LOC106158976 n=1 Tax=Lingula anatina TaxID=7574 RepID=A0A1S3HYB9_LINAN|nr:uncharacterized protein LOC106158976 [Lingula anatina]|eukprot:XP_013390566.1 uncharacterized protein LOC106158976 [Lingula anatina]
MFCWLAGFVVLSIVSKGNARMCQLCGYNKTVASAPNGATNSAHHGVHQGMNNTDCLYGNHTERIDCGHGYCDVMDVSVTRTLTGNTKVETVLVFRTCRPNVTVTGCENMREDSLVEGFAANKIALLELVAAGNTDAMATGTVVKGTRCACNSGDNCNAAPSVFIPQASQSGLIHNKAGSLLQNSLVMFIGLTLFAFNN